MANQQPLTSQDIDRMKSDAIRRARQMQSRATIVGGSEQNGRSKQPSEAPKKDAAQESTGNAQNFSGLPFLKGFNNVFAQLGLSSEQLIIFAIILMLCENRENRFLIMALIYIAL